MLLDEESALRHTRDSISIRGTIKMSTIRLPAYNTAINSSADIISYENGDVYEGKVMDNIRQGRGVLKKSNGDVFEGIWVNDDIPSNSNVTYSCGGHYRGNLKNLQRDGLGKFVYSNGDIYDGVTG